MTEGHNLVNVFLIGSVSTVQKVEGASRKGASKATSASRVQFRCAYCKICIDFKEDTHHDISEICGCFSTKSNYCCIGTFTLSNLGMFGVDRFDAILPPGQVII